MTARACRELVKGWLSDGSIAGRLPELVALQGVPQREDYHAEGDAYTHTLLAMEAVAEDADCRVFWGALLHDIGKATTTEFVHGRWRSIGHAEAGARLAPAVLARLGLSALAADVAWLVKHHLFYLSWNLPPDPRLTRSQLRFMAHPLFPQLLQVCAADAAASLGKSSKGDIIRLLAELYDDQFGRG